MRIPTFSMLFFTLAMIAGCGPSKEKMKRDIASREERLFTAERAFSRAGADSLIREYRDFVAAFPDDSLAPAYLFKAATMTMNLQDGPGAMNLFNQIRESYPGYEKTPLCLFFIGYVQENILGDINQARETYLLFIETYPGHEFTDDAQVSIDNLGKTPEQMIREFETRQKEAEKH